jgi:CheY-like chemotaxis protein
MYLQFQLRAAKMNAGAGPNAHFVGFALWPGIRHLSKTSFNAVRVGLAKPLIVCVEDDPIYLILRKKVLEQAGYTVTGVTSAAEALNALRETPVCAVIADHMLQGTTGTELANEMKQIKPDVPIILFSGNIPERLAGVDVYVNKGEPTSTFLNIVREVVRRYRS